MATTKVYTRGGDTGETSLLSGERVSKADHHIAAVGDLDELSVALGFARLSNKNHAPALMEIQKQLYQLSAEIAYTGDKHADRFKLEANATQTLETMIDAIEAGLPPLKDFIYPGQSEASCRLHQARVVARRVERGLSMLPADKREASIPFINRLSDLLFVMARDADHVEGKTEKTYRE